MLHCKKNRLLQVEKLEENFVIIEGNSLLSIKIPQITHARIQIACASLISCLLAMYAMLQDSLEWLQWLLVSKKDLQEAPSIVTLRQSS